MEKDAMILEQNVEYALKINEQREEFNKRLHDNKSKSPFSDKDTTIMAATDIVEKDYTIAKLEGKIEQIEKEYKAVTCFLKESLGAIIQEKDDRVKELEKEMKEKYSEIESLNKVIEGLEDHEERIENGEKEIKKLESDIDEKNK